MSDQPTRRAPPGWYADKGKTGYRYWDGESWVDPMARPTGFPPVGDGSRSSLIRQRTGLAFMGAAVALLVAGLVLPWAENDSGNQGALDGDMPWLVGPGGVADTWLLVAVATVVFWALLVAMLSGNSQRVWLVALVAGLATMGFCVAEGLALDDELDLLGAQVGSGLLLAYAGGASAAVGGVLLRQNRRC